MKDHERTIAEGRVAGAYAEFTASPWTDRPTGDFASIRELREALPDIPRADLDDVLISLYAAQVVNLIPQSNQQALTEADRASALWVGGEHKHLVCWTGS